LTAKPAWQIVIYGTGAWKMDENKGMPAFKHAYEMGKQV
jgi:hypothetical protein